jgi:hypothetical protein
MNKIINVTENGSNRKLAIVSDKIIDFDTMVYKDGKKNTIIKFINNDMVDVIE